MRYTPMRCTPEVHAHEVHACEMHAHEIYACEMHVYEVHAHEMHAHEVHAHEAHVYKVHAYEVYPGVFSVFFIFDTNPDRDFTKASTYYLLRYH